MGRGRGSVPQVLHAGARHRRVGTPPGRREARTARRHVFAWRWSARPPPPGADRRAGRGDPRVRRARLRFACAPGPRPRGLPCARTSPARAQIDARPPTRAKVAGDLGGALVAVQRRREPPLRTASRSPATAAARRSSARCPRSATRGPPGCGPDVDPVSPGGRERSPASSKPSAFATPGDPSGSPPGFQARCSKGTATHLLGEGGGAADPTHLLRGQRRRARPVLIDRRLGARHVHLLGRLGPALRLACLLRRHRRLPGRPGGPIEPGTPAGDPPAEGEADCPRGRARRACSGPRPPRGPARAVGLASEACGGPRARGPARVRGSEGAFGEGVGSGLRRARRFRARAARSPRAAPRPRARRAGRQLARRRRARSGRRSRARRRPARRSGGARRRRPSCRRPTRPDREARHDARLPRLPRGRRDARIDAGPHVHVG